MQKKLFEEMLLIKVIFNQNMFIWGADFPQNQITW